MGDPVALELTSVHRFWSEQNQSHFYTTSEEERDFISATYEDHVWRYEGVAFRGGSTLGANATPVYRFWSNEFQSHFYTSSEGEKTLVEADPYWELENIAWYVDADTKGTYRFYSESSRSHFYTSSAQERDSLSTNSDWTYEGEVTLSVIE